MYLILKTESTHPTVVMSSDSSDPTIQSKKHWSVTVEDIIDQDALSLTQSPWASNSTFPPASFVPYHSNYSPQRHHHQFLIVMMVNTRIWHWQCRVCLLWLNHQLQNRDWYYHVAKKRVRNPASNPDAVDSDGLLADIKMTSLTPEISTWTNATKDVNEFFDRSYDKKGSNGQLKKHQDCKLCLWVMLILFQMLLTPDRCLQCSGKITLIADTSTLRRHIAFKHKVRPLIVQLRILTNSTDDHL